MITTVPIIAPPPSQPPASKECEYQIKVSRGAWKCIGEQEYQAMVEKDRQELQVELMLAPLCILGGFCLLLFLAFVRSSLK